MTPEERYKRIKYIKRELDRLIEECPHVIAERKNHDTYAICAGCGVDFGWYCPSSSDHVCHYYSSDGKVELITGEMVPLPPDYDSTYETMDCCIFCGKPEERK